jgi:hypothetical protein
MVSGDVVNGLGAVNTLFSFQPAASVEVCLTQALVFTMWTDLTNGVLTNPIFEWKADVMQTNGILTKIMINNTNYISMRADGTYGAVYTGIQIK